MEIVEGGSGVGKGYAHTQQLAVPTPLPISLRDMYSGVCKLFVWKTEPNFAQPWQKMRQRQSTGSAFVIHGRRIITNAHCITHASQVLSIPLPCTLSPASPFPLFLSLSFSLSLFLSLSFSLSLPPLSLSVSLYLQVLLRPHGSAVKYPATVAAVAHDCDLALLTVKAEKFWSIVQPLTLDEEAPHLQDAVFAIGYPRGGDNISITSGVVSRIDVINIAHSASKMLTVQIDAAINSGNSGGPALKEDKVVGVSFQGLGGKTENIGYIIPVQIIHRFLRDIESHGGEYRGMVGMGLLFQKIENEQLKRFTKLDLLEATTIQEDCSASSTSSTSSLSPSSLSPDSPDLSPLSSLPLGVTPSGILVCDVDPLKGKDYLQVGDVVLAIDDFDIAEDGTVVFREKERVSLLYALTDKLFGDPIRFTILRDGNLFLLTTTPRKTFPLVPQIQHDEIPRYLIYGGCVFVPLSGDFIRAEFGGPKQAPTSLLAPATRFFRRFEGEEVLVLSQVLAGEITRGYELKHQILESVNGVTVRNLQHLADILDESKDIFIIFGLSNGVRIVLEREGAEGSMKALLVEHNIVSERSSSLVVVQNHQII